MDVAALLRRIQSHQITVGSYSMLRCCRSEQGDLRRPKSRWSSL